MTAVPRFDHQWLGEVLPRIVGRPLRSDECQMPVYHFLLHFARPIQPSGNNGQLLWPKGIFHTVHPNRSSQIFISVNSPLSVTNSVFAPIFPEHAMAKGTGSKLDDIQASAREQSPRFSVNKFLKILFAMMFFMAAHPI